MTPSSTPASRFLFITLGHLESDFYGRVGAELVRRGHTVGHVTTSRRAAQVLRRSGVDAWCLPDLIRRQGAQVDVEGFARSVPERYAVPSVREAYRTDFVCDGRPESWCVERTVRHLAAMEHVFDAFRPDVVIPEVGNETIRTAGHLVGLRRDVPVLFLFYTIFPKPLRLYVDTMQAPIVPRDELPALTPERRAAVERFASEFTARRQAIRARRDSAVTPHRARMLVRHPVVKVVWDRDNDYLRPVHLIGGRLREQVRRRLVRPWYRPVPTQPYVYFPLHLTDDYKIKRLIPHLADQAAVVEQVARALPEGWRLVTKEHPMGIGRTSMRMLWRLRGMRTVHIVPPETNSHDLVQGAGAVVVISSTVGVEALLYGKGVLTLGDPFYAGQGVTVDGTSQADIRELVPKVLHFTPDHDAVLRFMAAAMDRCLPGVPVLVDDSDANAVRLAGSIEQVGGANAMRRRAAAADSR